MSVLDEARRLLKVFQKSPVPPTPESRDAYLKLRRLYTEDLSPEEQQAIRQELPVSPWRCTPRTDGI